MARHYRYFDEMELRKTIKESVSLTEVLRKLNRKPVGGTMTNLSLKCKRLGIDTSHFIGQAHNKGKPARNRRTTTRFVMGTPLDHRVEAKKLRRALLESGIEYKCMECSRNTWNGKQLVLEVDHIDGQYWNNQKENLQFLCPNCHSLKEKL